MKKYILYILFSHTVVYKCLQPNATSGQRTLCSIGYKIMLQCICACVYSCCCRAACSSPAVLCTYGRSADPETVWVEWVATRIGSEYDATFRSGKKPETEDLWSTLNLLICALADRNSHYIKVNGVNGEIPQRHNWTVLQIH